MVRPPIDKIKKLRNQHQEIIGELEKFKLLIDSVQDYAIFLLDEKGYVKTWNLGAQKNKGYKPEEIIGKHFSIFYMPEDVAAEKPKRELEIATQFGRAEDEDWRVRKDGSRFWASVVITALRDQNGKLIGFGKVTRDLTERKKHEDELRKANILLQAQQRELRALNNSKDDFISLASHQLRTPATAIKQLLGLFVEGFQPDIAEYHLNIIKSAYESNERQINTVNSLLKVAQVDAGKVKLRLSVCDITELMGGIVEDFRDTFQERKQTVELKTEDPPISIIADSQHLRMALENLVSNATKYTHPNGTIKIKVGRNKEEIYIALADNGVGIAKNDLKSLFEKFKRFHNDLSEEVGGAGLGLYWANKVIMLHGGRIEVESKLNEGSTFKVFLPTGQ